MTEDASEVGPAAEAATKARAMHGARLPPREGTSLFPLPRFAVLLSSVADSLRLDMVASRRASDFAMRSIRSLNPMSGYAAYSDVAPSVCQLDVAARIFRCLSQLGNLATRPRGSRPFESSSKVPQDMTILKAPEARLPLSITTEYHCQVLVILQIVLSLQTFCLRMFVLFWKEI